MPNAKGLIDALQNELREINFEEHQTPTISNKDNRHFKDIGASDKLILCSAVGVKYRDKNRDSLLEERIKDYSINYSTGNVTIAYKEPISYTTITIDLNKEDD